MKLKGILYKKVKEPKEKIEFPTIEIRRPEKIKLPKVMDIRKLNITYPLLEPFAFANIRWDEKEREVIYKLIEPELSPKEKNILRKICDAVMELIEVSLVAIKDTKRVVEYLEELVRKVIKEFGLELTSEEYTKIMYYIYRNFVGMDEIEPLLQDPFIEDISCDGVNLPIYVIHRNFGSLKTNLIFEEIDRIRELIIKMAEKCGRYVSYAEPILAGTLPDGSRVSATLAPDVATRGGTFTIRKFTERPFSPIDQIELGTASSEVLAYFWHILQHRLSTLIIGGTATGKTSFLNTICMFIPREAKIVSIEDTRELRLVHEHWVPGLARVGFGIPLPTGEKYGAVSLFDLLRESFRQAPDYVVVGETRGSIRGNEEVVIIEDGITKRIPIKDLKNKNLKNILVPTLNKNLKISLTKLTNFIKHPDRKLLIEVTTRSGRKVVVTPDHSLFTQIGFEVMPIETEKLKVGDRILIPAFMPCNYNDIEYLNLPKLLPELRLQGVGKLVKKAISKIGQARVNKIIGCIARQYCRNVNNQSIPIRHFKKLLEKAKIKWKFTDENLKNIKVRCKGSETFPALIPVNKDFCRFLGYFVAEGHLEPTSVVITTSNKKIRDDIATISEKIFGIKPKVRNIKGLGKSKHIVLNSIVLRLLIEKLGCGNKSKNKRIPTFIYGLSQEKICAFLRGLYSGDGSFHQNEISYHTTSVKLAEDLLYLLLTLKIVARFSKSKMEYRVRFKRIKDVEKFLTLVGFANKNLKVIVRGAPRTAVNKVLFSEIEKLNLPRKYQHLRGYKRCSKYYLEKVAKGLKDERLKKFASGEFFLDEVTQIKPIYLKNPEPVYDLSVNPTENFIGGFGGIVLHNSEAYVMFQGMAAGHPCMSTFHAGSIDTAVKRLTSPPIELSPTLIESLNVIVVLTHAKEKGPTARRVREVVEIVSVDPRTGEVSTNPIFRWNSITDEIEKVGDSVMLRRIAATTGAREEDVIREVERKKTLLDWLKENGIRDYIDVCDYINRYYKNPEEVMAEIKVMPKIKPVPEKPKERISFWELIRLARRGK